MEFLSASSDQPTKPGILLLLTNIIIIKKEKQLLAALHPYFYLLLFVSFYVRTYVRSTYIVRTYSSALLSSVHGLKRRKFSAIMSATKRQRENLNSFWFDGIAGTKFACFPQIIIMCARGFFLSPSLTNSSKL